MSDSSFRDALLKQNGETTVETQSSVFDDMMKADRQHMRRLTIATIAVWAVWALMLVVGLGLPMVLWATAPRVPHEPVTATTTTTVPAQVPFHPQGFMQVAAAMFAIVVLATWYCLPLAGIIMLVMMIVGRRSATIRQVQASLASINAQLKLILNSKMGSTGPPQG